MFLISDDGVQIVVRTLAFDRLTMSREIDVSRATHLRGAVLNFGAADLVADARARVERIRADPGRELIHDLWPRATASPMLDVLLLARLCAQRGAVAEACALCDAARLWTQDWPAGEGLMTVLKRKIHAARGQQAVAAFADPSVSRRGLADLWRRYVPKAPELVPELQRALLDDLESLIAEDEAHARQLAAGTITKGDLADLVFDLRNEATWIWRWAAGELEPGDGIIRPSQASGRLVKLGLVAVPALVAAATDPRPSRVVAYFDRFGGSFDLVPIGDVALGVLEGIFQQRFNVRSVAMPAPASRADVRRARLKQVQEHWERVKNGK